MKIDNIEIDSFKIRIPFEVCEIIDESILGNWILINEVTGIIDEATFKDNSVSFNINGIKTKFAIEHQFTNKKIVEKFIIVLINSKTLETKYFEGITKYNIKFVYRFLISLQVIKFSFKDFVDSEITDVDFKRDRIQNNFRESLIELYSLAKQTKNFNEGCKLYRKKNNEGIQFSNRKTTSIITSPFLKIYNKEIELKRGSKDSQKFYGKYLFDLNNIDKILKNRIRCEFTIKNKKHFRMFNIYETSLKNILNIPQSLKREMLFDILNKHLLFEIDIPKIYKENKLSNTNKVIINLIYLALQENQIITLVIENIVKNISPKQRKYEWKKRLFNLYNSHLIDNDKLRIISRNKHDFLKWLIS